MLPAQHIEECWTRLAQTDDRLTALAEYIRSTWIISTTWPPTSWSQFMRPTRTNNDVEGWHRRFNTRAFRNGAPNLYQLITELYRESKLTLINVKLISAKKITKRVKKSTGTVQGKLMRLWSDYDEGDLTTSSLLKACSHLVGNNYMSFG